MSSYHDFLSAKIRLAPVSGFDVSDDEINPILKPHQRDIVQWAVRGGRRAIFAAFGLGKSVIQIEILRIVTERVKGRGLIVLPLGVRQEFRRDGQMLGVDIKFIRRIEEADETGIYMTNYETVRDGKLDPNEFAAVSLDEASVLRSYGSKTYQTFLSLFSASRFRFVATATPSPNRYKELIHYAGFLGIMDTGQALTRFFQRDSTQANNLTLYPHKEREFWLWLNSWAIFLQRPSDLGYSNEGYDLPPFKVIYHEVQTDLADGGVDRDGQMNLIRDMAIGVVGASKEKRDTLETRVAKMMEIVYQIHGEQHRIGGTNEASETAKRGILRAQQRGGEGEGAGLLPRQQGQDRSGEKEGLHGRISQDLPAQEADAGREGRAEPPSAGAVRERSGIPGEGQGAGPGQEQAQPRSEAKDPPEGRIWPDSGAIQSDACGPERRLRDLRNTDYGREGSGEAGEVTVGGSLPLDGEGARHSVPSVQLRPRSFSGQRGPVGEGDRLPEQIVIWCDLNDEQVAVEAALKKAGISFSTVTGAQSLEEKEAQVAAWKARETTVLISKPVILGSGVNLQQCCRAIFLGIGFKFNDFIQAIHRIHRFLQGRPVEIHIIYAESEREILRTLQAKWERHDQMVDNMSEIIREHGLDQLSAADVLTRSIGVERVEAKGEGWLVANNDCVEETRSMPDHSVDLIVTSIPFSNHYEYTPSYNDFGHTDSDEHFFGQMDFLTPELLRILKPGRIYACHVKDRILFGNVTGKGVPTVNPFHAKTLFHCMGHGFDYLGMVQINTDVVRENNQTYRLGYTEMRKDGTKMGVGSPEYLLIFRAPQSDRSKGYADDPVKKTKEDYSLARWQVDAHAFWRSSGDRLLTPDELASMGPDLLAKTFTEWTLKNVYDYETHIRIGEALEKRGALPSTFMALAPGATSPWTWHDVNRMRTLNGEQSRKGLEFHICPLQFDIVDRVISRFSEKGDLVFDPFGGLFTVPYRALRLGRRGRASELNPGYFLDGIKYLEAMEREIAIPSLFDVLETEREAA